jgi:hypothetical protein
MRKIIVLSLLILASCTEKKAKIIAEVACGQCQFDLTTQDGCDLAVRVDGKAYFVEGFKIDDFGDAHDEKTGFCEVIRKGKIAGKIENNKFVASSIKLVD